MNKVVIFGSINLDLVTIVETHPTPGETVSGSNLKTLAGGKGANQALAASYCKDVKSYMVGAVGKDNFSKPALTNLTNSNLNNDHITHIDNTSTGIALIAVDQHGENTIIVTPGANHSVNNSQLNGLNITNGDVLLTQNELLTTQTFAAHKLAKKAGAIVIHNAAPAHTLTLEQLNNIHYLIINETELAIVASGFDIQEVTPHKTASELAKIIDSKIIVTLGEKGAFFTSKKETLHEPPCKIKVVDTTGAGDAFCGTFAANIALKLSINLSLKNAIKAGGKTCAHFGAQKPCT